MSSNTPLIVLIVFLISVVLRLIWGKRAVERVFGQRRRDVSFSQPGARSATEEAQEQLRQMRRENYPQQRAEFRAKLLREHDPEWFEHRLLPNILNPAFDRCDLRFDGSEFWDLTATFSGSAPKLVIELPHIVTSPEIDQMESELERMGWQRSPRTGDKEGFKETYRRVGASQT